MEESSDCWKFCEDLTHKKTVSEAVFKLNYYLCEDLLEITNN